MITLLYLIVFCIDVSFLYKEDFTLITEFKVTNSLHRFYFIFIFFVLSDIPPFLGFMSKYYIFLHLDNPFLMIFFLIFSLISTVYHLRMLTFFVNNKINYKID